MTVKQLREALAAHDAMCKHCMKHDYCDDCDRRAELLTQLQNALRAAKKR